MNLHTLIHTNAILKRNELTSDLQEKVPEGAIYFEGIVSNGEKNRNGYIIKSDAWFKDGGAFVNDFLATGSVLWNHDSNKPIGRPLTFKKNSKGEIEVSGYVFDDNHTSGAIGRKIVMGLSTGHITVESSYINEETGVEITEEQFWELPFSEIFSDKWTWVVTNAEICEFSFTATRSNRASVVANKIERYAEHFKKDPSEVKSLFSNHIKMGKNNNDVEPEAPAEVPVDPVASPEAPATTETKADAPDTTPTPETPQEEPTKEDNSFEKITDVATLHNHIRVMKENHASAIQTLENDLKAKYTKDLEVATNALRNDLRESLGKSVGGGENGTATIPADAPKNAQEFRDKHFPKKD